MGSENESTSLENVTKVNESIVDNSVSVTFGALILSIVFLLGVPGNLFIIWSILARARKRSVTTLLILNLACADGCLMCLTIFFIIYLAKQNWIFGGVMCKMLFYLCNTNMYASIMIITLMSLHRLVAVVWPAYLPTFTRRRTVLLGLGAMWIVVFLLALPALIFREKKYNGKRTLCATHHSRSQHVIFQYTLETVVGFLVPYVIMVSSYACILRRLRQTMFKRVIRSENLIQAIIVTFCILWLPYHIINVVQVVAALLHDGPTKNRLDNIWHSSRAVTSALAFISSCANPILYTFAGRSYIKADGLAFMARLFEGTVLDYGARRNRQTSNLTECRS